MTDNVSVEKTPALKKPQDGYSRKVGTFGSSMGLGIPDSEFGPQTVVKEVDITSIEPWIQVRDATYNMSIEELTESVKVLGQLVPGLATPHPEKVGILRLVAGNRRKLACEMAGLKTYKVVIVPNLTEDQAYKIALSENASQKAMNILEYFPNLMKQKNNGLTDEQIAAFMGRSRAWVTEGLMLKNMVSDVYDAVRTIIRANPDSLSRNHIIEIARSGSAESQKKALSMAMRGASAEKIRDARRAQDKDEKPLGPYKHTIFFPNKKEWKGQITVVTRKSKKDREEIIKMLKEVIHKYERHEEDAIEE